jgi:DNA-binding winged helix-turn-helix (wHTH) protein
MRDWAEYPETYRQKEVTEIAAATQAGESVLVIGLSGAGKSNLLGYLAHRLTTPEHPYILVDANRLLEQTPSALFRLIARSLGQPVPTHLDASDGLEMALTDTFQQAQRLTLVLDRFDIFLIHAPLLNNLRALRDSYKYRLTYVLATRQPLSAHNELAELFHAHTLWLGPLSQSDSLWNVARYARRKGLNWSETEAEGLIAAAHGYPSLLRSACEAYADGTPIPQLATHPAVRARLQEFWSDQPSAYALAQSGLSHHPWLMAEQTPTVETIRLTLKEKLLFDYLRQHLPELCEKDDLIRAAWPEDAVFERGVRDDSLAQLIRRLRRKIEDGGTRPQIIQTVPGRGYRLVRDVHVVLAEGIQGNAQ